MRSQGAFCERVNTSPAASIEGSSIGHQKATEAS